MTENTFNAQNNSSADISAYENVDLTKLNTVTEEVKPTEVRLEKFLIRAVFFAKVFAWIGILGVIIVTLYGWTRSQTQTSWLMNLEISKAGGPLCTWMNRGFDAGLRKDTVFRDYLNNHDKKELTDFIDNGKCIAPDTIVTWLELEKTFATEELTRVYEKILPKKFL
jgi:hypothetical protein